MELNEMAQEADFFNHSDCTLLEQEMNEIQKSKWRSVAITFNRYHDFSSFLSLQVI